MRNHGEERQGNQARDGTLIDFITCMGRLKLRSGGGALSPLHIW